MKIEIQKIQETPTQIEIDQLESFTNFSLPKDYVNFISNNGIVRFSENNHSVKDHVSVEFLFSFGKDENSIESVLSIFDDRLPKDFLPIASCTGGNMLLINKKGNIYFWDHEYEDDEKSMAACEFVSPSFSLFISDLVPLVPAKDAKICSVEIDPEFAKKMGLII